MIEVLEVEWDFESATYAIYHNGEYKGRLTVTNSEAQAARCMIKDLAKRYATIMINKGVNEYE